MPRSTKQSPNLDVYLACEMRIFFSAKEMFPSISATEIFVQPYFTEPFTNGSRLKVALFPLQTGYCWLLDLRGN